MTWNKDNPRFRRSSFLGVRRNKRKNFLSRLSGRFNGLFKNGRSQAEQAQRPHPPAPSEQIDDLKIAVPKAPRNVSPPARKKDAAALPPLSRAKGAGKGAYGLSGPVRNLKSIYERIISSSVSQPAEGKEGHQALPAYSPLKSAPPTPVARRQPAAEKSGPADAPLFPREGDALAASETPSDDYKINRLERVRRKRVRPPRNERMEAGLGCDPKDKEGPDPVCRPPQRTADRRTPKNPDRRYPDDEGKSLTPPLSKNKAPETPPAPFAGNRKEDPAAGRPRPAEDDLKPAPDLTEPESAAPPREDKPEPPEGTPRVIAAMDAAALQARKLKERRLIAVAATALALVTLVIGVIVFLILGKETERPVAKVARLPQASLPKVAPIAPGFFEFYALEREAALTSEVTIETGGSLGKALEAIGLGSRQGVGALISYMTKDDIVPVVQPGDIIRAFWADRGRTELARLEYVPNPKRTRADLAPLTIMRRPDGGFWHYRPSSPLLTLSAAREATIDGSLWSAGSKVGLDAGIIASITEILASDIDFMTNIQRGDTFQVLYSRDYRDGQPKGEPIIDMIKLTNRGRSYEYYRYVSEGDQVSYYDPEGRSSRKAFFMTPLQYKRISSQFSMTRLHPIHKVVRPHQGVDYAAPSGTPVSSVSDGTVVFCGWNGGYGKLVTIKHDETYTTMYAHLSKFAAGLKKGSVVRQGDLIGYVGATGTATGPHLDFRMKRNGTFIDPLPVLAEQKGKELKPEDKQIFIEKVLTPLRDEMTKKLLASRDNF